MAYSYSRYKTMVEKEEMAATIQRLEKALDRYSMSAGQADQFKAEATYVRQALGFKADADDVSPVDLLGVIFDLKNVARSALDWIDSVPQDTKLPTMPGFDRDWAEGVLSKIR